MAVSALAPAVARLLEDPRIWKGNALARAGGRTLSSGHAVLDRELPGGGWPLGAPSELLAPAGHGTFSLLRPLLARCSSEGRQILLVDPPAIPYAPAWAASGIAPQHLTWLTTTDEAQRLWVLEQTLRAPGCLVIGWLSAPLGDRHARRLQLAAEQGGHCHFLVHTHQRAVHSPLALRLRVQPAGEGLQLHVLKRRGPPLPHPLYLSLQESTVHAVSGSVSAPAGAGSRLSVARAG